MNKNTRNILIAVIISLLVGGTAGFFLGIGVSSIGETIMAAMTSDESKPEVDQPKKLVRETFEVQYPSNWKIDTEDEDYDPDVMFSIDSPGNTFVMFIMGHIDMAPEENVEVQIAEFKKMMGKPMIQRFEKYGRFKGQGAILQGKMMGSATTVKVFSFNQDGFTMMVTEQYPDEDLEQVQSGLDLIERSFLVKTKPGDSNEPVDQ